MSAKLINPLELSEQSLSNYIHGDQVKKLWSRDCLQATVVRIFRKFVCTSTGLWIRNFNFGL